mgnify:CR=1 FL=1
MPTDRPYDRNLERLLVSPGAILSLEKASELLPIAKRDARTWLRQRGLVRDLEGRDVVVWADVIAALQAPTEARPKVLHLRREAL